jgi:hypothetical protein
MKGHVTVQETSEAKFGSDQKLRYFIPEQQNVFRQNFNRSSFAFTHTLANSPLFTIPRLIQLASEVKQHPQARYDEVYFDAGDIKVTQRWADTPKPTMSPEEAIERIHTAGAWMLIRRAELVPEYRVMLDECMGDIQKLLGLDLDAVMQVKNAIVFITSPRRITTYHIDRECNFLLQISGDKVINIFDKNDRTVLPETELEKYWAVDNNAAVYKPEHQDRARVYKMVPGDGVHIPVNAPHWVTNGESPSVSLSVNFEFKNSEKSDVYRTNYYLRQLGLRPTPPGESPLKDEVKRRLVLPAIERAKDLKHSVSVKVKKLAGGAPPDPASNGNTRRM